MRTWQEVAPTRLLGNDEVVLTQEERQAIADEWNANDERRAAAAVEQARCAEFDQVIAGDATIQQLKAMTPAQFDTWWDANVTSAAHAIAVLKRLARVVIRRLL